MSEVEKLDEDEREFRQMEQSLAFTQASGLIESSTIEDEDGWLDVSEESLEPYEVDGIQEAVHYLDQRGLIERHTELDGLIKIRDESEATR